MGYSVEFVLHMKKIIASLETNNPSVMLTECCDVICEHCPNRRNHCCLDENKVSAFDHAFLLRCGVDTKMMLSWQELKALALEKIIRQDLLSTVCKDCQWQCYKKFPLISVSV